MLLLHIDYFFSFNDLNWPQVQTLSFFACPVIIHFLFFQ